MKNISNRKTVRLAATFVVVALCISAFSAPAMAQYGRRPGPPPGYIPYGPPPPPRRTNDFDRALAVVGTVGAIAAIASNRNNNYYYYHRLPVITPSYPVVVERPIVIERPVTVERPIVVERQVVVERQTPVAVGSAGSYSPKLGANFRIENMEIPGHRFTAARLMSDPVEGSPLRDVGLRKGDVITRLNDAPTSTLAELEQHTGNMAIRYIKTGTTKVVLANIYIPRDAEVFDSGTYHAP